ncbi:MAG: SPW repeat protein [Aquisalimonadaceae bacterium]
MANAMNLNERWRDGLMLAFGVWLVISPFVLGYAGQGAGMAMWNPIIVGLAVIVFAAAVLMRPQQWEEWINLVLGVWLILAPFVLMFWHIQAALWNHLIFGVLIAGGALWSLMEMRAHHGGHRRTTV